MKLAFDRSARRIDADGRLHVDRSHISKATVNPYYGKEIPGYEALGLQPDVVYRLLRDPVELERAAPTFARLPVLSEHVPITVAKVAEDEELKKLIVGAIGSDVTFAAPYLDADLCVWDSAAIAGIETDKVRELSCAYRYVPVMEPGEFEGQPYDGRMTEIQGNHLALVEVGRAGSDVVVADRNPFNFKETAMKMSKLGKALFAALCAASPVLAADSALPALVGNANRKTFKPEDVKAKLLALDASLDSNKLDAVLDAILDVEQDPKPVETPAAAADESPADKLRALLAGKVDDATMEAACGLLATPAADEAEPGMKKEEVAAAMDGLRKELREAEEARRDVRPIVGDVMGMDSAADVYGFALDHMKVDRAGVEGAPALRALFKVAAANKASTAPVHVAQDSAGLAAKFPGAARFRNA
ncbi:MAG TPA: DUF2213 domain-containing protein [Candidatus Hydrogenedentes bacterium]|nr:DUF2213 domain-containing protein [Candidatus Hydrogenedentota bacterium]